MATELLTSESIDGPTPNGGVRSTIYYRDKDGNPAAKQVAVAAKIVEFDVKGDSIFRTYAVLGNDANDSD